MKIALIQQSATDDRDANRRKGLEAVDRAAAAGAKLVAFAELAFDRFLPQVRATPEALERAEPIPGPTTEAFAARALEHGIVIVLNVFEVHEGKTYDSSPVIDADGSILGITRMVHITDYPCFHEQGFYTPGDRGAPVYDTAAGKLGVSICYDRHYPEYMRALAVQGAEIVVIPQAGTSGEWPEGLYEAEMRVAAFQNGYFAALCNRVGTEDAMEFAGESFVCDPNGRVICRAGNGADEILYCDIDLAKVQESHARKLFLQHRRPELYAGWLAK